MSKILGVLLPTWRQSFLMLAAFVVVSAISWTVLIGGKLRDDAALVPSWFNLWERCRVSIEGRKPLDISGLVQAIVRRGPVTAAGIGRPSRTTRLRLADADRFVIEENEWGAGTGSIRSCKVKLADWYKPLSKVEIARLTYVFLEQRSNLLAKGTHVARDPDPSGITSAGFGPRMPNAAGCPVVSLIYSTPEDGSFMAETGEQAVYCTGSQSRPSAQAIGNPKSPGNP